MALPWELLYADDLVVIAETEDLIKRLNEWKNKVENRGMRVTSEGCKMAVWCRVAEVLLVIQYNLLGVRCGYTRSVVV